MALYNKYRSQKFADIRGQETAVRILKSGLAKRGIDGVPQVSIFVGPHGTGKTSIAKIMAKAVNCENLVDGEPCCKCESCIATANDLSPCVTMLDAAANGDVAHVRDIIEDCRYEVAGNKKVYILDEVQMFSNAAWNALLKTLEEPPKDVFFILCTTESLKIAATAKSRCQEVLFKAITPDVIKGQLEYICKEEGFVADDDALAFIAESADGHMRDAISDLEKYSSYERITKDIILDDKGLADEESCMAILRAVLEGNDKEAFRVLNGLQKKGRDTKKLCGSLIRLLTESALGNGSLDYSEELQVRLRKALIEAYPNLSMPQASFYLDAVLVNALKEESVIAVMQRELDELKANGVRVVAAQSAPTEVKVVPFYKEETLSSLDEFRNAANGDDGIFPTMTVNTIRVDEPGPTVNTTEVFTKEEVAKPREEEVSKETEDKEIIPVKQSVHFELLQLVCRAETEERWFRSYDYLANRGEQPYRDDYNSVYECDTDMGMEELFASLQDVKPEGYRGRSASTSDVFHYGDRYFYVDRKGYVEIWQNGFANRPIADKTAVSEPVVAEEEVVSKEDISMVENIFDENTSVPSAKETREEPVENEGVFPDLDSLSFDEEISDYEAEPVLEEPVEEAEPEPVCEPEPVKASEPSVVGSVMNYEDMLAMAKGMASPAFKEEKKEEPKSGGSSILTMSFFDDFEDMFKKPDSAT